MLSAPKWHQPQAASRSQPSKLGNRLADHHGFEPLGDILRYLGPAIHSSPVPRFLATLHLWAPPVRCSDRGQDRTSLAPYQMKCYESRIRFPGKVSYKSENPLSNVSPPQPGESRVPTCRDLARNLRSHDASLIATRDMSEGVLALPKYSAEDRKVQETWVSCGEFEGCPLN